MAEGGFGDIDMQKMERKYPEYDDMSYDELTLEDQRLEDKDNLLDVITDETIDRGERRNYLKKLIDEKFPDRERETSFGDKVFPEPRGDRVDLRKPDERQEFIVSEFIKDENKTRVHPDALQEIRNNYEFVRTTKHIREKNGGPGVLKYDERTGKYSYNEEASTSAN